MKVITYFYVRLISKFYFKTNLTCLIPSIYSNHISDVVIQRANDVPYGLCASVWSENSGRIHRVASKLQVWLSILGIWFEEDNNANWFIVFIFAINYYFIISRIIHCKCIDSIQNRSELCGKTVGWLETLTCHLVDVRNLERVVKEFIILWNLTQIWKHVVSK